MDDEKKWYVIQTRPLFEKKVLRQIEDKKIEVFLPEIETIRIWSDRKKRIHKPLFSGYLFVNANPDERIQAITNTVGALRYVMYQKRPAIVTQREIDSIKISLNLAERVNVENTTFQKGDEVMITSGPLSGLKGIVTEARGHYKLLVNIIELSASLSIELFADEISHMKKINEYK
ncbi:MAG: UpxY family transcription antiterminator [Ignavibacteria bacterium]|nr:UpxY family transcription antiterminator [Ignavibacteria bacterium]